MEKITSVTIPVPYKSAGNVIRQKEVDFDVFKGSEHYSIKPVLSEAERTVANLPEALDFHLVSGKTLSNRGTKDGNLHVIEDVVALLKEQNLIA